MRFRLVAIALMLGITSSTATAADSCGSCRPGRVQCPRCSTPCQAKVTKGTESKRCWGVECKKICIPRVTFPWQTCKKSHCQSCSTCDSGNGCDHCADCPKPRCGRTRYVRVLMKHEYECPVCKYSFEPVDCGDSSGCSKKPQSATPAAAKDAMLPPLPLLGDQPVHIQPPTRPTRPGKVWREVDCQANRPRASLWVK